MSTNPIYLFKQFALDRYGEPIFRIPIDLGTGCPHRNNGTSSGCTFCPENGARAVQLPNSDNLEEQIAQSVDFAKRRYKATRFMAYLQTYTNTMNAVEQQQEIYDRLMAAFPFDAISIATRPDCLPPEVLNLLEKLSKKTEVWIDLGIQTVHDKTLQRINRGHDWQTGMNAINELAARNLLVCPHIIVGLPGETRNDFLTTAETMAQLPIAAIKIHNLHIIRNTVLATAFKKNPFPVADEYEYGEILIDILRRLPATLPIMRMTTDTQKDQLLAPRWTMKKGQFTEYVTTQMQLRECSQGDLQPESQQKRKNNLHFDPVKTEDSSITFYNPDFNEHYHTPVGARTEAEKKYLAPARLPERLAQSDIRLLDICFGLGYNSLASCEVAMLNATDNKLSITALEMDRRAVGLAAHHIKSRDYDLLDWSAILDGLYRDGNFGNERLVIDALWGDARFTTRKLQTAAYDIVFLDAFSTQRNSQLWTLDFSQRIRALMKPDAILCTYCAALPVRGGLLQAGFHIGESIPVGRKRSGTVAALNKDLIANPIPSDEMDLILNTPRGLPYRDPRLVWSNSKILRQREKARKNIAESREY